MTVDSWQNIISTKCRNEVFGYFFVLQNEIYFGGIHNWLYCFTNPLELGKRVSLSHFQLYVLYVMQKRNTCSKFKRISETI